jgi:hypothetical protein
MFFFIFPFFGRQRRLRWWLTNNRFHFQLWRLRIQFRSLFVFFCQTANLEGFKTLLSVWLSGYLSFVRSWNVRRFEEICRTFQVEQKVVYCCYIQKRSNLFQIYLSGDWKERLSSDLVSLFKLVRQAKVRFGLVWFG